MLGLRRSASDEARRALVLKAVELCVRVRGSASIDALIELLETSDPALLESAGVLAKEREKLLLQLSSFRALNQELLSDAGEPLDAESMLGLGRYARPGKTRLAIVSTRFFDSNGAMLFWVAQLLAELNRYAARRPNSSLQALVMFDEADLYLPAVGQPATKAPMESLLKRARSAGLGLMLATQSPGDLDYRCRENVLSWMVGRVKEPVALEKLKPLAGGAGIDPREAFPKQKVGQFHLITEDRAKPFAAERSLLDTKQLGEREILELARRGRG